MKYYLGCPMWANSAWKGSLFSKTATKADFLKQYSSVLNAVEGNTTFYGLPQKETLEKWAAEAAEGFRFCFKFPKTISHQKRLLDAHQETAFFLTHTAVVGPKLGPYFLQLPPSFEGKDLPALKAFIDTLPAGLSLAVEVRHPCFVQGGKSESDLDEILSEYGADRVIFDTENLQKLASDDPQIQAAQRKKPKLDTKIVALGRHPFVRFVGHPEYQRDHSLLKYWAQIVAQWIAAGKTPYVFMHQVPDDDAAPEMCRYFHRMVQQSCPGLEDLPPFPADLEPPEEQQLSLF